MTKADKSSPISGVSPEPGTLERVAKELASIAIWLDQSLQHAETLRQDALKEQLYWSALEALRLREQLTHMGRQLRVLAGEVRELGESLKNWIEVAMRAGEKAAEEIDWERTFHPPPVPPEEKRTIVFHLWRRIKEAMEKSEK